MRVAFELVAGLFTVVLLSTVALLAGVGFLVPFVLGAMVIWLWKGFRAPPKPR